MKDPGMVPFVHFFPEQAMAEVCIFSSRGHPTLPDDDYAIFESYCAKVGCNCRRVILNVAGRTSRAILASISYGFDRDEELAGPFLDPLNIQSEHAEVLLRMVQPVLADPAHVARLEAHYYQVKGAITDPTRPARPPRPGRSKR